MKRKKVKFNPYTPTGNIEDYKEAIQIIFVDYANIWVEGKAKKFYKEIDKKLRKILSTLSVARSQKKQIEEDQFK